MESRGWSPEGESGPRFVAEACCAGIARPTVLQLRRRAPTPACPERAHQTSRTGTGPSSSSDGEEDGCDAKAKGEDPLRVWVS